MSGISVACSRFPALLLAAALPVSAAASCPPAPDHSDALEQLLAEVQAAPSEREARLISNRMWQYWADAPDARAQEILDRGMVRRAGLDLLGALADFDALIAYCPEYAEGYNQRAFVHYLRRDFASALNDLDHALALSPRHVAALSGRALSLYALSHIEEARAALAAALLLNPWLPERSLAAPGGPLAPVSGAIPERAL
ncbi:tetratricopeptide repeat protein [Cribrihabitans neustonicus]|uniref:tetratricopeptide repeat protein n=1 Tax=Cribrihabitans neustonicus TaxID=1429085 RepID=UPI003B598D36